MITTITDLSPAEIQLVRDIRRFKKLHVHEFGFEPSKQEVSEFASLHHKVRRNFLELSETLDV